VLTNQMLILDLVKHCHQLNCLDPCLGHVADRDDLQ
jgi:hypothetical protein